MDIHTHRVTSEAPDRKGMGCGRVTVDVPKSKVLEGLFQYRVQGVKDRTYRGNTGECGCADDHEPQNTL